jgi:photosystem II stability/assembly factor-like uncharacterized protein
MTHTVRCQIALSVTGGLLVAALAAPAFASSNTVSQAQPPQARTTSVAAAQAKTASAPASAQPQKAQAAAEEPAKSLPELRFLKYRALGPSRGGRVDRVVGVAGDPRTYYAAAASSGVWKSVDGGVTWKPIFDDQTVATAGSIAVAPSDPNVVYVGTGEANIRGDVQEGDGIYKSTDAGKTWKHVWTERGQIGTLIVHPTNPDIAFAAVLGRAFGPNPERGVYRTRDGGRTWQQVLKKDSDTGASDVAFDPSNANVLFAGMWQARRMPWDLVSGGPGSGLYLSRDGGDTWRALTGKGLPDGIWGKVGVAVAASDGRCVYALIEAVEGGLFRSDDGGETWERVSGHHALRQRAWYYTTITVDPLDENVVWFPEVPLLKTIDGGRTVVATKGPHHGDYHDLWIDPKNPRRMIVSNDGGVDVTVNGGETWFTPLLPLGQFYHVAVDTRVPFHLSGAQQDVGTAAAPSNSLNLAGLLPSDWYSVGGGEAGYTAHSAADPNIIYASEYLGYISAFDYRTRQSRDISAWPENPSGHGGEDMRYRFQWTAPIALSPHDPHVVYYGGNVLFRTADNGATWTVISPDLTRNDRSKEKWAGGPITGDNTGVETYCTIFAIAESPKQKDLIWAGSDDGLVHVTRDGGKTWKNVTAAMTGMPEWGTVSIIEPSPFDAATAYFVVDAHRLDDTRPYLYKTSDFGETWKRLDAKLPPDVYLHAVREDPTRKGLLYVGTERGVMMSPDDGASWQPLQLNLPTVAVHDLVVKGDSLVLATHGRSFWILDDLVAVRNLTPQVAASDLLLFPIPDTIEWRYFEQGGEPGAGQNPPAGAAIHYYLKAKPKGDVTLEILDAQGKPVRTLTSKPKVLDGSYEWQVEEARTDPRKPDLAVEPGVHCAIWDLRWEGAKLIPGAKLDNGDPKTGPLVLPGTYTLKLTVDGQSETATLVVRQDPRVKVSSADLAEQVTLALAIRDDVSRLTSIVERLQSIEKQARERSDMLKGDPKAAALVHSVQDLAARCEALEGEMQNPKAEVVYDILAQRGGSKLYSRMSPLMSWVVEGDGAPTQGDRQVYAEQRKELDGYQARFQAILDNDLAAVNRQAASLGFAFIQ